MTSSIRLPLEMFYQREAQQPNNCYLIQPYAGGRVEKLTWSEVGEQARRAANWLRGLELPQGSCIAIISKNCAHWIIADLAIWMAGHVSVPLYPNLTADSVRQVLEHSEAKLVFVGKLDDWPSMAPGVPQDLPQVALPLCPEGELATRWSDLQAVAPIQDSPVRAADQLATLIYTSGTTGMPKGVMHNFSNFAFGASHITEMFAVSDQDRLISYLPLCHVAERMFVEMGSLYCGMQVFFGESLDTFVYDLRRARPTLIFGVPRIWTKFQMGVFAKKPQKQLDFLLSLPLIGRIVGRKVMAGLGLDAVRYALSGAAPTPVALFNWYQRMGMELLEVYGMTENCGYSHISRPGKQRLGWIGQNSPGVEVRFSEVGELQVRSAATMQGYFKEPEKTAEALTEDGFLRTGDKGEQDAEGYLRLTGRIKEIFKTSKGKYVAPAPIENRLAEFTKIEQVCVVGDGMPQPLALCVLSESAKLQAAGEGRAGLDAELQALLEKINAELDSHERLQRLVLVDEVWAIENGFMTPTLKIKRNHLESFYGKQFEQWQQGREPLLWQF